MACGAEGLMPDTRPNPSAISPDYAKRLGTTWPAVAERLGGILGARGTAPPDIDDALQTAAERALRRKVPFDGPEDLFAWALTVAERAVIDAYRRKRRIVWEPPPDSPDGTDVDRQVRCRLALEALAPAVRGLRPRERDALLEPGAVVPGSRDARTRAVVRFRARAKLAAAVEGLIAWLAFLVRRLHVRRVAPALVMTAALGATSALLLRPWPAAPAIGPSAHSQGGETVVSPSRLATPQPAGRAVVANPIVENSPGVETSAPLTYRLVVTEPAGGTVADIRSGTAPGADQLACHSDPLLGQHCIGWPVLLVGPVVPGGG